MDVCNVKPAIRAYVEESILPQYAAYDKAHNTDHIEMVLKNSFDLAKAYDVNPDMVYIIAAYHDIGMKYGRDDHHLTSARALAADTQLLVWFSAAEIEVMKQAVEDHRASAKHAPRSIYGKIVSDADRIQPAEVIIYRTMEFSKNHFPAYSLEEHIARSKEHLVNKYAEGGYMKFWLGDESNMEEMKLLRSYLKDDKIFAAHCTKYY